MPKEVPWEPDSKRQTQDPFDLMTWVENNTEALKSNVSQRLRDSQQLISVHASIRVTSSVFRTHFSD